MSQACLDIIANKEIIALSAPANYLASHPCAVSLCLSVSLSLSLCVCVCVCVCLCVFPQEQRAVGAHRSGPAGHARQARLPVAGPTLAQRKLGPTLEHLADRCASLALSPLPLIFS